MYTTHSCKTTTRYAIQYPNEILCYCPSVARKIIGPIEQLETQGPSKNFQKHCRRNRIECYNGIFRLIASMKRSQPVIDVKATHIIDVRQGQIKLRIK